MEFEDEITWSKRTYAISDLPLNEDNQGKCSFPLLVKITQGFYGIKEEDTVDIDQILVFNESGEETCVLARNEEGCSLSIPVNHPHRFQPLTTSGSTHGNHGNTETQTLREIQEKVSMPTKVRFDKTMYTSFTVADKLRNTEEFGALTLVSTHPVEYIQANPVYEGEIHHDHIMFIPSYRDVRFVIAEGPQPFVKSFLDVKDKRTQSHSGQTLSIIGYDDIELSDEEYELLVPGKLTKPQKAKKAGGGNGPQVNPFSEEEYETLVPWKLTKPQEANKTGGGNGPQVNPFSEEEYETLVAWKLTKPQEANKTGGGNGSKVNPFSEEEYETLVPWMLTKPQKANETGRGNDLQVNPFSEGDFELIVPGRLANAQEPDKTGGGKGPKVDSTMDSKPETGASSSKRDSAIQQRFSRDYDMVRSVKQRGKGVDLQGQEWDVFSNKGRYTMARSNSSVNEQARLPERSLQVLAGGRPGGGVYCRSTSAISQNVTQPKGGPPQCSSSLSNSPPTYWREPLPLANFSTLPCSVPSYSRLPPGDSNICSSSSNSSGGSSAGVVGSPMGECHSLSPISSAGVGGNPWGESPSLSPISSAGVGGSPMGESPCHSPINPRKGSMCITTLEEVPLDLSGLSVGDVCDCLQLLHLKGYIARFQEDQVDGALLTECSIDDLLDMELSPLHAKKLAMFTKGWRPKM